ncbi:MAG: hypothetical protein ABIQ44_14165 [Chloroflexia bacterium]
MGLTFKVGASGDVFFGEFAERVEQELARQVRFSIPGTPGVSTYYSEDVDWFGWAQFQQMATMALGQSNVPNILAVEAWRSVYLPIHLEPSTIEVEEDVLLQCASLPGLLVELEQLAASQSWGTDRAGLKALWTKHYEDDEATEIQTFIQLLLAAQVASERGMPLWVVK